ncbi:MAG: GspE/PulE family protein [Synergistota bacterium]|nr:GspE/PulE family protein [Synergistota bacterium]
MKEQKRTGLKLGQLLLSNNVITEGNLLETLANQLKLHIYTLSRYRPMTEALRMVPHAVAKRLQLVPLAVEDENVLLVAMADPLDVLAQDEVRMISGMEIRIGIVSASELEMNLERFYTIQETLEGASVEFMESAEEETSVMTAATSSPDDAPVVQLVNNVIEQAVREHCSDIHIEPFERSARVRYRIDGALYNALDYQKVLHPALTSRLKIMSGMDISERRRPQDGRILIKILGRRVDLRVSSLPTVYGEKIVIRILDQEKAMVGLKRLGLEEDDKEKLDYICEAPNGVVLVTGPTGSGKSTTLYSILEQINRPEVNIITVEDPVEYSMYGISQVQVNERAGLTFESTLRSILRQDPDKIMVGEIRDGLTAQLAIRAALTGHLVLSTLHTNDAPSAPIRLSDMGIAPFLVSSSLIAIIAQRLVRALCPSCKEEYLIPDPVCATLGLPAGTKGFKPVGCNDCRGLGYRGRQGIFEILVVTESIRELIVNGASADVIRKEAIRLGMKTLREAGVQKVASGVTSVEDVMSITFA